MENWATKILSLIKGNGQKQIKMNYLINGQTTLYVIKKFIPESHSNICGSYCLSPLAASMLEVYLGIMLIVTPVSKASFLVDKENARRLSNDATTLKRLAI